MIKYQATVTYIGPLVSEFLDSGIVVLFGEDAPEELRDFAIIHDGHELIESIIPGDCVQIRGETYRINAVGEVANSNLANLGHLVLKFNGANEVEMPGDVCVEARQLPEIQVGDTLIIHAGDRQEEKE
ncbi:MAG TPA: PTS glucitol/sorbitol transporter subunit IIA [Chloroflexi bacterium]|nr:PTS glucitol/sorbitol transporter subunit IIA [Chloroflexota bacterium]